MLANDDLQYFDTFGFLLLRSIFSQSEISDITAAAEEVWDTDLQGRPFVGSERQQINGFVESQERLHSLAKDDRIYEAAHQILKSRPVWIGSDGNRYVGNTGWHTDGSNISYLRIKFALYLDSLTRSTGALQVIPGSHRGNLHSELKRLLQRPETSITPYGVRAPKRKHPSRTGYGVKSWDLPSYAIETQPGDLILFNQNIWHGSFNGKPGRRMFTLNYGEQPKDADDLSFLRQMYQGQLEHVVKRQYTRRTNLFGTFLNNEDPRIKSATSVSRSLGFR